MEQAFENLAGEKARQLGCKVFCLDPMRKREEYYTGSFRWEGGSCAYTYSDLMGGELQKGKTEFSIPGLVELS